ncbi:DUF4998 domain-containing protein [Pelobium manganitolerans]|uniref:DUF4998 domain-containing protein n=1 Tax=Pelobium manganitolerans TaxID=1842495 RepID=UPI003FA38CD3
MRTKNILKLFVAIALATSLASCSKMDDYKKYVEGGEISYTGKLDSVKVFSGENRVYLKGLFIADPKVKICKVYWDNFQDSAVVPINRTQEVDTLKLSINNVPEGIHNFVIYTYDAEGNPSIPVYKTGRAYGERYKATLNNRGINTAFTDAAGVTTITWNAMDRLSGVFATDVTYTDVDAKQVKIRVPIDQASTVLPKFKPSSNISYYTLFLPDTLSIDTFYSTIKERYVPRFIKTDITATYMKNTTSPIQRVNPNSGRWGVLSDWVSNASVRNASGGNGGYEYRNNVGVISFEAGWGLPAVPNGLIYQTFTLPAGTYSFELTGVDQNTGGSRYIAVAKGNVMPDVGNITSKAIAFSNMDTHKLSFTLTESTEISLGFAVNIDASGKYIKIKSVNLYAIDYL